MIQDVTDADLERVRVFLEAHLQSSLFLLSNLALFGPHGAGHPNSGSYRCVVEDGQIVAVFSLTRRGNLLVQAGGRADLAEAILEACDSEPMEVSGVIGDWPSAQAIWSRVCQDPRIEPTYSHKDVLFSLALSDSGRPAAAAADEDAIVVRALNAHDFEPWAPLNTAYLAELGVPLALTPEQRAEEFESQARAHRWWGAFDGERLVSIAGLNAAYGRVGQVGGVYSIPEKRRQGWSRAVMRGLVRDTGQRFERLVLFTSEDNLAARGLYESLGFQIGEPFGLFLGTRQGHARTQRSCQWAGQSGEVYTYEIHEWPARLSSGPANYIFASSENGRTWHALLIGECADLSELFHHERRYGGRHAATHVHVRVNFNPAGVRRREAADLAARWTPSGPAGNE